jgi:hypothetical protein
MKKCRNCGEEKVLDFFGKNKRTPDGRQQQCKQCVNVKKKILNSKRVIPDYKDTDTKICSRCKLSKFFIEFSNTSSTIDGKMYECKSCRCNYHTPKIEGIKVFSDEQLKLCVRCETIKLFSDFNAALKNKTGVINVCKKCKVEDRKKVKNRIKEVPPLKTCTKCNIEKAISSFVKDASKSDGIYCVCKSCTIKHRVDRCNTDMIFRLSNTLRRSMTSAFINCAKGVYTKNTKTEVILCASFSEMRDKIEVQFSNWMNWGNYGKYNGNINYGFDLDHIIPISYAKTEDEIYLLNHWSNFQPLCSKVNRDTKKAKVYPCTNLELRITFWEDHYEYI